MFIRSRFSNRPGKVFPIPVSFDFTPHPVAEAKDKEGSSVVDPN
jgi:hypothetical protein